MKKIFNNNQIKKKNNFYVILKINLNDKTTAV